MLLIIREIKISPRLLGVLGGSAVYHLWVRGCGHGHAHGHGHEKDDSAKKIKMIRNLAGSSRAPPQGRGLAKSSHRNKGSRRNQVNCLFA